jgi:hypothetical protein
VRDKSQLRVRPPISIYTGTDRQDFPDFLIGRSLRPLQADGQDTHTRSHCPPGDFCYGACNPSPSFLPERVVMGTQFKHKHLHSHTDANPHIHPHVHTLTNTDTRKHTHTHTHIQTHTCLAAHLPSGRHDGDCQPLPRRRSSSGRMIPMILLLCFLFLF